MSNGVYISAGEAAQISRSFKLKIAKDELDAVYAAIRHSVTVYGYDHYIAKNVSLENTETVIEELKSAGFDAWTINGSGGRHIMVRWDNCLKV